MSEKELEKLNNQSLDNDGEIEINIKEYIDVIIKRKKLIFVIALFLVSLVTIKMFLTPNSYKSEALITQQTSSGGSISSMVSSLAGSAVGGLLGSEGSEELTLFENILNSRDIANIVVDKLDLINVFKKREFGLGNILAFITSPIDTVTNQLLPPSPEEIAKKKSKAHDNFVDKFSQKTISIKNNDKTATISIVVNDKDPVLAQKIADEYLIQLGHFLNENNTTVAKKNRIFLEEQLIENKENMRKAEEALKRFQEQNKVISPDKQAELTVATAAGIESQISIEQMNLNIMKSTGYKGFDTTSADNNATSSPLALQSKKATEEDIRSSMVKIQQLKKQLNNLTFGETFTPLIKGQGKGAYIPLSNAPNLSMEFLRLQREVMVQNKVFEFLTEQYEAAKLSESNESISFIVINKPKVSYIKDQPKRVRMIIIGGIFGLFLGIGLALGIDWYLKNNQLPGFFEKNEKDNKVTRYLKELLD